MPMLHNNPQTHIAQSGGNVGIVILRTRHDFALPTENRGAGDKFDQIWLRRLLSLLLFVLDTALQSKYCMARVILLL